MKQIADIIRNCAGVDDFRVTTTERQSYELFFVHRSLETVRSSETTDTAVTVYLKHDGKLGSSDFTVHPHMTEAEISEKAAAALKRAKLVFNEPYELPSGGSYQAELPSNFSDYSMPELAERVADAVYAADCMEGGSINAVEIFLYRDTVRVVTSRGIDKTQVKYHAMIEAIPTWNGDGGSVELYENYQFTEFDPEAVTAEIAGKMREVRDRQHAQKPQTPLRCNIVLNSREIAQLVSRLSRDQDYASIYSHANRYSRGDDLQPGTDCDKLTLTRCGQLTGSAQSAFFDADGLDLDEQTVLSGGVFVNGYGSVRFASYLGEKPTGDLPDLRLAPGTLTEEQLKAAPYLECISLSGLQLDLYSDYIGGEIRLAYYYDGETTRPVTGISMSAKLSEVLASLRLSEETVTREGYSGPAKALLQDVSIL